MICIATIAVSPRRVGKARTNASTVPGGSVAWMATLASNVLSAARAKVLCGAVVAVFARPEAGLGGVAAAPGDTLAILVDPRCIGTVHAGHWNAARGAEEGDRAVGAVADASFNVPVRFAGRAVTFVVNATAVGRGAHTVCG